MTLPHVWFGVTLWLLATGGYCGRIAEEPRPPPVDQGFCSIPLAIARDSINIQVGFSVSPQNDATSDHGEATSDHGGAQTATDSQEGDDGAQGPGPDNTGPQNLHDRTYIQVEFQTQMLISGMVTQGSPTSAARVTHFKVLHSRDCAVFTPIVDRHTLDTRVFAANLEPNTTTTTMFLHVFQALCVRVVPTRRIGDETAMRFELLGCQSDMCTSAIVPKGVQEDLYWQKLIFDTEKIVTSVTITLNPTTTQGTPMFFIVYSRTCNFDDFSAQIIQENHTPVVFMPEEGSHVIVINGSYMPIRAKCLAVYIPDRERLETRSVEIGREENAQRSAVEDFVIEAEGCDALEHHEPVNSCGKTRLHDSRKKKRASRRRQKRVVRGDPVIAGEYPWLVSLHYLQQHEFTDQSGLHHLCGASLIADQWVLTAAHCFDAFSGAGLPYKENWLVVLGEHHQDSQDGTEQYLAIDKIIPHPDFVLEEDTKILNDIALVKLSRPAVMSEYVNTVCLEANYTFPDFTPCITAGWGFMKVQNGVGVELPNYAEVRVMPQAECAKKYEILPDDHETKKYVSVEDSVMCAVDDEHGSDSCWGDSGGPLICYHDDHWTQAGIVSIGYECGNAQYPAIYTRVSHFMNWIEGVIANNTDTASPVK